MKCQNESNSQRASCSLTFGKGDNIVLIRMEIIKDT